MLGVCCTLFSDHVLVTSARPTHGLETSCNKYSVYATATELISIIVQQDATMYSFIIFLQTALHVGTHRKIIAKLSVVEIKHKCNLANIKDNESNEREGNEVLQTK